jgi:uncharacterized protein YkwD
MHSRRFVLQLLVGVAAGATDLADLTAADLRRFERRVFDAVNRERRRHRLQALIWDERLAAEARRHSKRMATAGFYSHTDPVRGDLIPRLKAAKIVCRECGENIFIAQGPDAASAPLAVRNWLKSPGHRKNMLNPLYTHSGVGAAVGRDEMLCLTQEFTLP